MIAGLLCVRCLRYKRAVFGTGCRSSQQLRLLPSYKTISFFSPSVLYTYMYLPSWPLLDLSYLPFLSFLPMGVPYLIRAWSLTRPTASLHSTQIPGLSYTLLFPLYLLWHEKNTRGKKGYNTMKIRDCVCHLLSAWAWCSVCREEWPTEGITCTEHNSFMLSFKKFPLRTNSYIFNLALKNAERAKSAVTLLPVFEFSSTYKEFICTEANLGHL